MKLKRKKLSIAEQNSYDAFNLNFEPKPESILLAKKKKTPTAVNLPAFEKCVYIGQTVHIRPSYIVSLPAYHGSSNYKSLDFMANMANLQDRAHKGLLSNKAIGKMKNSINWLLCSAEPKKVFNKKLNSWFDFKVNFITLTLPDTLVKIDNAILQKQLLNPFLTYLRKFHKLKNYVWKLEFQKNGKLHVHFIADVFIHHAIIRNTWNSLLGKNNFLIQFCEKFKHANPNSTDIHSIKKIKNLAAYLAKYMTKNSGDLAGIKGRIWGCNQELSKANQTQIFVDRDACHQVLKPLMQKGIAYKPIEKMSSKTKIMKRIGEIFFLNYRDWFTKITGKLQFKFNETILELKNITYNPQETFTV